MPAAWMSKALPFAMSSSQTFTASFQGIQIS